MDFKLKDVAMISTGHTFRSRLQYSSKGDFRVIQMKDLGSENMVNCDELLQIDAEKIKEHHLAKNGDLIFRSRGINTTAAIFKDEIDNVVISSPLIKIKVNNSKEVLPEYLLWIINSTQSQKFLQSRLSGTHGGMIRASELAELIVAIPDITTQKTIVDVAELVEDEYKIAVEIAKLKKDYYLELLVNKAKGE